jgi:hypothetical protein
MTRHLRPTPAEALYAAIPVLETERFVMRGYRPEDLAPSPPSTAPNARASSPARSRPNSRPAR